MTSIVIVGSGFTGFTCARRLARILGRRHAPVDITIISPVDYMLYTPLLPDVAGGVVDARFVTVPLANTLKGVHAVRGRVDGVDFARRTLTNCDPEQRSHRMSWDRLVLTPGSVTRLFDVPGLATNARGLKTTAEALYLRDHFVEQLELANIEDDPKVTAARRTVVVVVASYSGTELVAQLRALADAAAVDLAPGYAVANPLNVHLSGLPAKVVTRSYHLYAIPRPLNRWAVSLDYLTDALFDRSVVSIGLSSQEDAQFTASEGIRMPKTS